MGQAQASPGTGVGHRRLYRPGRDPQTFWGVIGWLLRKAAPAIRRKSGYRLQRGLAHESPCPLSKTPSGGLPIRQRAGEVERPLWFGHYPGGNETLPLAPADAGRPDQILRM